MKRIKLSFIPAICWLIILTFLLLLPGTAFPIEDWLDKIWFDKWVHLCLFAILVFLWCRAMLRLNIDSSKLKRVFILVAIFWLAYGIAMEFVQKSFVAYRSFEIGDIIADGVGCAAGLIYSIKKYLKK